MVLPIGNRRYRLEVCATLKGRALPATADLKYVRALLPGGGICCAHMAGTRSIHNLALIGFMGTGKSSVGRLAADALHFTFLDTDHVIEARASIPISEIFAKHGEPVFRDWERKVVGELTRRTKTVIATGGGLPAQHGNLESLKTHALVICLWASPESIYERVREHSHRPLLQDPEPLEKIRQLLAAREASYRQADVLVNTEMRSVREVASQVVHQFHMAQAAHR